MALPKRIFALFDKEHEIVDWNTNQEDILALADEGDTVVEFKQIRRSVIKVKDNVANVNWKETK